MMFDLVFYLRYAQIMKKWSRLGLMSRILALQPWIIMFDMVSRYLHPGYNLFARRMGEYFE